MLLLSVRKMALLKLWFTAHFTLTSQAVSLVCLWVQKRQTLPKAQSLLGKMESGLYNRELSQWYLSG